MTFSRFMSSRSTLSLSANLSAISCAFDSRPCLNCRFFAARNFQACCPCMFCSFAFSAFNKAIFYLNVSKPFSCMSLAWMPRRRGVGAVPSRNLMIPFSGYGSTGWSFVGKARVSSWPRASRVAANASDRVMSRATLNVSVK